MPNPHSTLPCPYVQEFADTRNGALRTYVSNGQGRRPTGAGQNESALQPGDMAAGREGIPADFLRVPFPRRLIRSSPTGRLDAITTISDVSGVYRDELPLVLDPLMPGRKPT
jgi:hypothetical protein